jgi:hypothetical protein
VEDPGLYSPHDFQHRKVGPSELVGIPGIGPDDTGFGNHPGVVVNDGRAYLFLPLPTGQGADLGRRSPQLTQLLERGGRLRFDRHAPKHIHLTSRNLKSQTHP